ncbi:hypothetical protein CR513_29412, partial [Mucuna pruriens]
MFPLYSSNDIEEVRGIYRWEDCKVLMIKLLFGMELWRKKGWLVLLGAIVLGEVLGCGGCFEEEKGALLELKATYGNESFLQSWVDNPKSNCCAWERVTCDSSSGHVIHLSLSRTTQIPNCLNNTRLLNYSLFLSFRELTTLVKINL